MPLEISKRRYTGIGVLRLTVLCFVFWGSAAFAGEREDDIPDSVWETSFSRAIDEFTKRGDVPPLREKALGKDDLEVRIWSGFGEGGVRGGIAITQVDDVWNAVFMRSIPSPESEALVTIKEEVDPSLPWNELMAKLTELGIFTLPDAHKAVEGYPGTVIDGTCYVVEFQFEGRYRWYHFCNPGYFDVPEARKISKIVMLIDDAFSLALYSAPRVFPATVSGGQVMLIRKGDAFGAFQLFDIRGRGESGEGDVVRVVWACREDGESELFGESITTGEQRGRRQESIEFGPFAVRWRSAGTGRGFFIYYPDPTGEKVGDPDRPLIAITDRFRIEGIDAAHEIWEYRAAFVDPPMTR